MKKASFSFIMLVLAILSVLTLSVPAFAKYGGGSGIESDRI